MMMSAGTSSKADCLVVVVRIRIRWYAEYSITLLVAWILLMAIEEKED